MIAKFGEVASFEWTSHSKDIELKNEKIVVYEHCKLLIER